MMHNIKSAALSGYTPELLCNAKLAPTGTDPAPEHLLLSCLQKRWNSYSVMEESCTFSGRAAPYTQAITDQLQWATLSVGCTPASWFNLAPAHIDARPQISHSSMLPTRAAPPTSHLCMSLTSTATSNVQAIFFFMNLKSAYI